MKFYSFAALALVAQGAKLTYKYSEGPTKVDLGENDDNKGVLTRADDDGTAKWQKENPLSWTDGGDDDAVVLTMLDGSLVQANTAHG